MYEAKAKGGGAAIYQPERDRRAGRLLTTATE
jgi:hypothetical protein